MDNGRVLSPSVEMLEGYNRVTCTTVNNSAAACSYLNGYYNYNCCVVCTVLLLHSNALFRRCVCLELIQWREAAHSYVTRLCQMYEDVF